MAPMGWSFHPAKNAKWVELVNMFQPVPWHPHDIPAQWPQRFHRRPRRATAAPLLWPDERGPWLGELSHGGTPIAGWFRTDNPKVKWRIFILIWGYPHFRKPPIFSIVFCVWPGQWIYRILTCWEFRSKIHGGSPGIWWRIHHRTKRTMLPGLVNVNIANWKIHPFFMGKSTISSISMAYSYVTLTEDTMFICFPLCWIPSDAKLMKTQRGFPGPPLWDAEKLDIEKHGGHGITTEIGSLWIWVQYMEYIWKIYGIYMEYIWNI